MFAPADLRQAEAPTRHPDQLLQACQRNWPRRVRDLVEFANPAALRLAARWCHVGCVYELLQHQHETSDSLHACVQSLVVWGGAQATRQNDQLACVQLLLDHGADPKKPDKSGKLPVEYCNEMVEDIAGNADRLEDTLSKNILDHLVCMRSLLWEYDDDEMPAIFRAVLNESCDDLKRTLADSEDIDGPLVLRRKRRTALIYAVEKIIEKTTQLMPIGGLLECLRLLLESGADPNEKLSKPLYEAHTTSTSNDAMMENDNRSVGRRYNTCMSRLCWARLELENHEASSLQAAQELLKESGGVVDDDGLLEMAFSAARRGKADRLRILASEMHALPDVNVRGRQGMTLLHFACRSGSVEAVRHLLGLPSIDISLLDDRGKLAIDAARSNGHEEIVKLVKAKYKST